MRTTLLPDGTPIPVIGQGTYRLGENEGTTKAEIAILKGIAYGMILIDTAEDYAGGGSEKVVGEAISQRQNGAFVVTKVLPRNAAMANLFASCERSLERLRLTTIDLYLLHWWRNVISELDASSKISLQEIVEGFEALKTAGKIKRWGVANFNLADMKALLATPGGENCMTNQVLYNLARRGIEHDLLPWCQKHKIPIMAYSPLGVAWNVLANPVLHQIAECHNATPAQIALTWVVRHEGVIAIPKADRPSHTRYNAQAVEIALTQEDYAALERAFPL